MRGILAIQIHSILCSAHCRIAPTSERFPSRQNALVPMPGQMHRRCQPRIYFSTWSGFADEAGVALALAAALTANMTLRELILSSSLRPN
jgi:hypothetical protein